MKNSFAKANRIALLAFLAVVVAIVLVYLATIPIYKSFKKASLDLSVKRGDIAAGKEWIDNVNQAYTKLNGLKQENELLDVAMPQEPMVPEALIQINEIVSRAGLKIISLAPTIGGKGDSQGVEITLSVEGPFKSFQEFFRLAEKNLRPIAVKSINLVASQEGNKLSGSFQLNLPSVGAGQGGENGKTPGANLTVPPAGSQPTPSESPGGIETRAQLKP